MKTTSDVTPCSSFNGIDIVILLIVEVKFVLEPLWEPFRTPSSHFFSISSGVRGNEGRGGKQQQQYKERNVDNAVAARDGILTFNCYLQKKK